MSNKHVAVGDIILIPAGNEFVPAKVLYLSQRYKNVILLGLYKIKMCEKAVPPVLPNDFGLMLYTSQEPVLKKRWISIGQEPLLVGQQGLAKRIVAGDVWLDDQHLGAASNSDRSNLPQMDVLGAALVEKKAAGLC